MTDAAFIVTNKKLINSVKKHITRREAEQAVKPFIEDYIPESQKVIFYPYYWILVEYTIKTLIGKSRFIRVSCLVDMINNIASTTDGFEREDTEAISEDVLSASISEAEAFQSAKHYLTHASLIKMKALSATNMHVLKKELIYKAFWIIKCSHGARKTFNLMLDAVTGKYHAL